MKWKKLIKICIFILIFGIILPFINAANIGVSPATINFKNVLRGGYSERGVIITIDSEKPVGIEVNPRGEVAEWLNFSSVNFSIIKNEPYQLIISVSPPEDIPNGNCTGFLLASRSPYERTRR